MSKFVGREFDALNLSEVGYSRLVGVQIWVRCLFPPLFLVTATLQHDGTFRALYLILFAVSCSVLVVDWLIRVAKRNKPVPDVPARFTVRDKGHHTVTTIDKRPEDIWGPWSDVHSPRITDAGVTLKVRGTELLIPMSQFGSTDEASSFVEFVDRQLRQGT